MIRWFSIRRLLLWTVLSCFVMVSMVWTGRRLVGHQQHRRASILAMRKARLRVTQAESKKTVPPQTSVQPKEIVDSKPESEDTDEPIEKAWPIQFPAAEDGDNKLTDVVERPFKLNHADIKQLFNVYKESGRKMEEFLRTELGVSLMERRQDGETLKASYLFEQSIIRHVALYYFHYRSRGGSEERHAGEIPACAAIGLDLAENDSKSSLDNLPVEVGDERLEELAGSQGTLHFLKLGPRERHPFGPVGVDDPVTFISKRFTATRNDRNKRDYRQSSERSTSRTQRQEKKALRVFAREHYAIVSINHPSVIQPVCYDRVPKPRMVYPYLKGGDMVPLDGEHLSFYDPHDPEKRPLTPDQTFLPRFFRQLVEAVYAVHQAGIVHLDVKPENFVIQGPDRKFILPRDHPALKRYRLVLIDFGLSRRLEDIDPEDCLRSGTDVVMAPEQLMCNHPVGRGTDWWSVAASVWRMRIFWEPTIGEQARDRLLSLTDPQWGHYIYPPQAFFDPRLVDLLKFMMVPNPADRDFSSSPLAIKRLLDHPYLKL